jgi:hypothetical protein
MGAITWQGNPIGLEITVSILCVLCLCLIDDATLVLPVVPGSGKVIFTCFMQFDPQRLFYRHDSHLLLFIFELFIYMCDFEI